MERHDEYANADGADRPDLPHRIHGSDLRKSMIADAMSPTGASKMLFGASVPAFEDEPVRIDDHDLDIRRPGTTQNQELTIRQGEK